ncbi:MAG: hypothetical protein ABWK01_01630, partial [Infirmifilum sp.]
PEKDPQNNNINISDIPESLRILIKSFTRDADLRQTQSQPEVGTEEKIVETLSDEQIRDIIKDLFLGKDIQEEYVTLARQWLLRRVQEHPSINPLWQKIVEKAEKRNDPVDFEWWISFQFILF